MLIFLSLKSSCYKDTMRLYIFLLRDRCQIVRSPIFQQSLPAHQLMYGAARIYLIRICNH